MKRQIEIIRTLVAVILAGAALAVVVWTLVIAAPSTSPPELPTLTAPAPNPYPEPPPYPGPDPYPPPGYPAFLPVQVDVESYP